jgi:hypothetical protein
MDFESTKPVQSLRIPSEAQIFEDLTGSNSNFLSPHFKTTRMSGDMEVQGDEKVQPG